MIWQKNIHSVFLRLLRPKSSNQSGGKMQRWLLLILFFYFLNQSWSFFVKSQRAVLDFGHLTIFDITILSVVLQRKRKQYLIHQSDFSYPISWRSRHWIMKSQKFTVCTGSDFWPNRIQFSIVHDVTVLCTLTQGKIAVKSLSYLKHFRRRFSGELQPKVHSLTRFAAWEISSISQKIRSYSFEKTRYFAARLEFFFPQS